VTGSGTLLAVAAYVVPLILAGLLLSAPRRRSPWLIAGVLAALPLFYAAHFTLLQDLRGWPTTAALPEQFELLAFSIDEPDRARGVEGRILLWLVPSGSDRPRAHLLDYDRALHRSLSEAGQRIAEGRRQVGSTERPEPQAQRREGENAGPGISFRDMQRRGLPPKPTRAGT
jgi:hypothetical protein